MAQAFPRLATEPIEAPARAKRTGTRASSRAAAKRLELVERLRAKAEEADKGRMQLLTGLSDEEKLAALRGR